MKKGYDQITILRRIDKNTSRIFCTNYHTSFRTAHGRPDVTFATMNYVPSCKCASKGLTFIL